MRTVLIPHRIDANIYVSELGRAYQAAGCSVIYGSENLLEMNVSPDLVHLQWPEEQYRWRNEGRLEARVDRFLAALSSVRQKGARLAWTVHNVVPHDHATNAIDASIYQTVIESADLLVHHCPRSSAILHAHYRISSDKKSVIVPHGNYLAYPNDVRRNDARRRLGLQPDAFVYLHFGQIRGYKGLDSLFAAFDGVRIRNKALVVAGPYMAITGRGQLHDRLLLAWKKRMSRNVVLHGWQIPSAEIQLYCNAADCLVLSHSKGLNSGVAVLGMTFGKLIVGPRIGCIEWVLDQGTNLHYEAGNVSALTEAMTAAASVDLRAAAERNAAVARDWAWRLFPEAVLAALGMTRGEADEALPMAGFAGSQP